MHVFRDAVKADCDLLLNRFQQTQSVRYETFSQTWRDMSFQHIFYGTGKHESRAFSRLVLDTAYEFLLPPFTFQIRVGGVYLLHALFHCQSAEPPEKIRLALKDWEDLQKLEKDSLEAQHFDVVYVLRKLLHEKAFDFTAMPRILLFERKRSFRRAQVCETFVEKPSAPQTLVNNDLLEEMSNVHSLYENLKSSLGLQSESSLDLTHQDLVQTLRRTVLDFYRWQQDKVGSSRDDDGGEGTSTQHESSLRADLLASIKSRAYGDAAEVSRSRRHRAVEVDHVTKPGSAPSGKRRRKKSLRHRVPVRESGDIWNDALSDTNITALTCLTSMTSEERPPRSFKRFKWKMEKDF